MLPPYSGIAQLVEQRTVNPRVVGSSPTAGATSPAAKHFPPPGIQPFMPEWMDLGSVDELSKKPLQSIAAGKTKLAVSFADGAFSVVSGVCNHAGGPLGDGRVEGGYIVCPWHNWKFHCRTGEGEPGFEEDRVPRYESKVGRASCRERV